MPSRFFGAYEYRVDAKGRIPLPPAFREKLAKEGGVWAAGFDGGIRILPTPVWEKQMDHLAEQQNKKKIREFLRFSYGLSFELIIDGQGRATIPSSLRQQAEINNEAIVVGIGTYIEVWSPKRWQAESEIVIENAEQISESLE